MIHQELHDLAETTLAACRRRGWRIGTAESCTGGLIAAALTEISGSSDVVEGGFVTYSNGVKSSSLGVSEALLARVGAVSSEVAMAMADGALLRLSLANLAIAVTGIAGPSGGSAEKPVGLVHFGLAIKGQPTRAWHHIFSGDRIAVRHATVLSALQEITRAAQTS